MATWKVLKYRRADGTCPVDDWLSSSQTSKVDRRKVHTRIRMLQQVDHIPADWVVDYQTTELQRFKPNCQHRFLCIRLDEKKQIILLNGMLKKAKHLPADRITEAEALATELRQGRGNVEDFEFD